MSEFEEPFDAPYVVWLDGYTEGWRPYGFASIEECYSRVIEYSSSHFVITRTPLKVQFKVQFVAEEDPS